MLNRKWIVPRVCTWPFNDVC